MDQKMESEYDPNDGVGDEGQHSDDKMERLNCYWTPDVEIDLLREIDLF